MRTKVCEMFGISLPIFAFSHCRDVVVEASKVGGMGVFGAATYTPAELEQELKWIDEHIEGRPYGVDLMMPNKFEKVGNEIKIDMAKLVPAQHEAFVNDFLEKAGIPQLPADEVEALPQERIANQVTPEGVEEILEIAFRHPIKLIVSALGVPATRYIDRAHSLGIKVGALAGKAQHAVKQKEAGVDVVVAQGCEAGGHTGSITSMVLWPQIVDAVAPLPVLAAGGIGRGRQMAAALALGAEGIWCGSVWLGTRESEILPEIKERLFAAASEDAIQTKAMSGKTGRWLRSKYTEAWEQPGAPKPLPMPLQGFLFYRTRKRFDRVRAKEFMTCPVGQIVGDMKWEQRVRDVLYDLLQEFAETSERLAQLVSEE